ncbi:Cpe/LpqF family protein [Saccharomonospora sp.]|uniref:Cpe/LpqF family protein n=1 Tax=Saccharomonospora sp. TaxID=33913 RepID=UPI002626C4BB|nr:Cpe/LpqF family protein [Saccharomonospora sp.]
MLTTTETGEADATAAQRPLVESRMRWAVEMLAEPGPGLAEDPRDHFVAAFVDKHGDDLPALLDSWRARGPFTVESYTPVAHKG